MTQLEALNRITNLVQRRLVSIEDEKAEYANKPEDDNLSTLRIMHAELGAILDAVEDAMDTVRWWEHKQAMARDSSDGPVADTDDGYRLRPGEE